MPDLLLVLNGNRQIVYSNRAALDFLGVPALEQLPGQRPGEAVNCVNAGRPGDLAVVTVGKFQAGSAPNVIPDKAELSGTVRTVTEKSRRLVEQRIRAIAEDVSRAGRFRAGRGPCLLPGARRRAWPVQPQP